MEARTSRGPAPAPTIFAPPGAGIGASAPGSAPITTRRTLHCAAGRASCSVVVTDAGIGRSSGTGPGPDIAVNVLTISVPSGMNGTSRTFVPVRESTRCPPRFAGVHGRERHDDRGAPRTAAHDAADGDPQRTSPRPAPGPPERPRRRRHATRRPRAPGGHRTPHSTPSRCSGRHRMPSPRARARTHRPRTAPRRGEPGASEVSRAVADPASALNTNTPGPQARRRDERHDRGHDHPGHEHRHDVACETDVAARDHGGSSARSAAHQQEDRDTATEAENTADGGVAVLLLMPAASSTGSAVIPGPSRRSTRHRGDARWP